VFITCDMCCIAPVLVRHLAGYRDCQWYKVQKCVALLLLCLPRLRLAGKAAENGGELVSKFAVIVIVFDVELLGPGE